MPSARRLLRLATATAAGLALLPATADAGLLAVDPESCATQTMNQVFLPWADVANYTLAPGGDAESGNALTRTGGAAIVAGNEPWTVGSANDHKSIGLPAGSSVTTGALCVGLGHPTMRFFAKSQGTGPLSSLRVDVLFEGALGLQTATIGSVLPSAEWAPTAPYLVVANLLPLLPPNATPVAFRLTPQGSGTWTVDDLYVDPWRNG